MDLDNPGKLENRLNLTLGRSDVFDHRNGETKHFYDRSGAAHDLANARLIAAAPELLEALEFCAKMLDDDGGKVQGKMYSDCLSPKSDDLTGIEYIRAAIAKAKGEIIP
jgi:hypothetical protein